MPYWHKAKFYVATVTATNLQLSDAYIFVDIYKYIPIKQMQVYVCKCILFRPAAVICALTTNRAAVVAYHESFGDTHVHILLYVIYTAICIRYVCGRV